MSRALGAEYPQTGILRLLPDMLITDPQGAIDVLRTNHRWVMGHYRLDEFTQVISGDYRVPPIMDVQPSPEFQGKIAIVILCAGASTRSNGAVHALRELSEGITLFDVHMHRINRAELRNIRVGAHCSPTHIGAYENRCDFAYHGGWTPRLDRIQTDRSRVVLAQNDSGNPSGHWDALRWLVVSGRLLELEDEDFLIVFSVTNVGPVVTADLRRMASSVERLLWRHVDALAAVEVTPQPSSKPTGSFVTVSSDGSVALIKPGYGVGKIRQQNTNALMSTNTWWVRLDRLRMLLEESLQAGECLNELLRNAVAGDEKRRGRAGELFDRAFPIRPYLSMKTIGQQRLIQVERDLDQLSLLRRGIVIPMEVDPSRSHSVKSTAALSKWWSDQQSSRQEGDATLP